MKKNQEFFSEHMNNKGGTSSFESQSPEGFNGFFSKGFGSKQDSLFVKKFGSNLHFRGLPFDPDSFALSVKDFDGFFDPFTEVPGDSISSKSGKSPHFSTPKTMEDMMKMLKQQMQEMQKRQQQFFDKQKNIKKL